MLTRVARALRSTDCGTAIALLHYGLAIGDSPARPRPDHSIKHSHPHGLDTATINMHECLWLGARIHRTEPLSDRVSPPLRRHARHHAEEHVPGDEVKERHEGPGSTAQKPRATDYAVQSAVPLINDIGHKRGQHACGEVQCQEEDEQLVAAQGLGSATNSTTFS